MRFLLILLSRVLLFLSALWLIRGLLRKLSQSATRPQEVRKRLRKDPVCGTYVAEDISLKTRIGQEIFHFCSSHCQREYLSLQK
jgi:YHS domain-containing protein